MIGTGRPAERESLLAAPMEQMTRLALRSPQTTVGLAIALAAVCLVLTAVGLGYRTSRLDLLNPKSDYNQVWLEYIEEFGNEDDAVVVVEAAAPERITAAIDELAAALGRDEHLFHALLYKIDLSPLQAKGLHYLSPRDLAGVTQFVDRSLPIVQGDWSRLTLAEMTTSLARQAAASEHPPEARQQAAESLERLAAGLNAALAGQAGYQSPWPAVASGMTVPGDMASGHLFSPNGRCGFLLLRLAPDEDTFAKGSEATDALRERIEQIQTRHPDTRIGLTGLPILENDEMRASSTSMLWASLVSLAGVAMLFVAGFGGIRHALLANLVLLVGMAWAFGYVTLTVGHLNILSVSFTVTLIGIGIDYGIHYVSRYLQLRRSGQPVYDALLATSRGISPAIATGAITTAVSFFAAACTPFTGIAELGMIAGGGILLCAAAELIVLPAAILLIDRSRQGTFLPEPLPIHSWFAPLMKRPGLVLSTALSATLILGIGTSELWYDQNLLNMQAAGLESVELEHKLLDEGGQSAWFALSVAGSPAEALKRKAEFLELPSVERVEEIVSMLPSPSDAAGPMIASLGERLSNLPRQGPVLPVDRPEVLANSLARASEFAAREGLPPNCQQQLEQARRALRGMAASDCYAAVSKYQQALANDLIQRLQTVRGMADPAPPRLTDLPETLRKRFVGNGGQYLLRIYGRGNIWDTANLARFVGQVRSVDPKATGNPVQAYEASREMKQSYENAALYALMIIIGVLLFDFRRPGDALLASLPLALGVLQMFGLMGWLGIPLNPANMIALPLILGIGVDYGVHVMHEYRNSTGPYRMSPSTAVAVVVDSLTTIVGFGSLMIASHQGLQSMGRVLTIGVGCCLFTSMTILPAILAWLTRHHRDEAMEEPLAEQAAIAPEQTPLPAMSGTYTGAYLRRDGAHRGAAEPHTLPARRRTLA